MEKCGHTTSSGNGTFVCNRPKGHTGWHEQAVTLRGESGPYTSRTNWGSDGLAPHASADRFKQG